MQEIQEHATTALEKLKEVDDSSSAFGEIEEELTRIKEIADQELERIRVEEEIDEGMNPNGR